MMFEYLRQVWFFSWTPCVLIFFGEPSFAQENQTKALTPPASMGKDPFGAEVVRGSPKSSFKSTEEKLHQEKLELVRRIVEDVEADDTIAESVEEAEAIKIAEKARRSERQKLIQSIDGIGGYLAEIAREKLMQKDQIVGVYLLEMSEVSDVADKDVIDMVKGADQVINRKPRRLDSFEAALLYNVIELLKVHPLDKGNLFLSRVILERPEVGLKLHAADALADDGGRDTRTIIKRVVNQSDAYTDQSQKDIVSKLKAKLRKLNEPLDDNNSELKWPALVFVFLMALLSALFVYRRTTDKAKR